MNYKTFLEIISLSIELIVAIILITLALAFLFGIRPVENNKCKCDKSKTQEMGVILPFKLDEKVGKIIS